jgi:hypothetical protein
MGAAEAAGVEAAVADSGAGVGVGAAAGVAVAGAGAAGGGAAFSPQAASAAKPPRDKIGMKRRRVCM